MIFDELKKREVPYNVLRCYDSLAGMMNLESRQYSIIVLSQSRELISDLINDKMFYHCGNVYCYDLNKEEISCFIDLRLPTSYHGLDGTFYGIDLRKLKQKK